MPKVGVFAAVFDEDNRILCVKIKYGSGNWILPGGHLDECESPSDGAIREVLEETGYVVDIDHLVSIYSAPQKDEIVFLFKATIIKKTNWKSNDEIEMIDFFKEDALPNQIHPWNVKRIDEVYSGMVSNYCVFREP